jgi:hypothetical protein
MKKEIEQFLKDMTLIDWQPRIATFQLSFDERWGRHSDWSFINKKKQNRICEEVWKRWMLLPIIDNGIYMFFGKPWKRTEILEFWDN